MGILGPQGGKGINRRDFLRCSAGAFAAVAAGSMVNVVGAAASNGVSGDVVDQLLQGAFEMHVHGAPDVVPRKLTELKVVNAYKGAGLRGVMLKCHVTSTTSRAAILQEFLGNEFKVYGGLVLNGTVGGLNPVAVETELNLGAKEIWMPTIHSEYHAKILGGHNDSTSVVPLTDATGKLKPELYEIFDLIAQKNVILGTGHISSDECEKIVAAAQERGVKRIIITHPEYATPGMSIEVQKKLSKKDVMFERCFVGTTMGEKFSPERIANQIKAVGVETSMMATDFGQAFNAEPLEGFKKYIRTMMGYGISAKDIETMVKLNPAQILDL